MESAQEYKQLDKLLEQSLLYMRVSDLVKLLIRLSLDEFENIRKMDDYATRAFEHYRSGKSIIFFDVAMCFKYMIAVVNKESEKMMGIYKADKEDASYEIVRNRLNQLVEESLSFNQDIAIAFAQEYTEFNYREIVKRNLSIIREQYSKKSDAVWKSAEIRRRPEKKCYENLANAIIELGIRDYEAALSGFSPTKSYETPEQIIKKVKQFAREDATKLTSVDIEKVLERISRTYKTEFIPLVNEHARDIIEEWNRLSDINTRPQDKIKVAKYKCPNCGDVLRKGIWSPYRIECCGCNLSAVMPDDVVEELKHRSRGKRNV